MTITNAGHTLTTKIAVDKVHPTEKGHGFILPRRLMRQCTEILLVPRVMQSKR